MATDTVGTGLPWVDAIAASFDPYRFAAFHRDLLPELVARHGALVVADLAGAPPLAFRIEDGTSFTWLAAPAGVTVVEGDGEAATLVELSERTFSEHLHELLTASGAVRTGRARLMRGDLTGWQRWEPAIQSLLSARPILTDAVRQTLLDRRGEPLDLHHSFGTDDDADEIAHFLNVAGYVHVKSVFDRTEVEAFGEEVEHVRSVTTPGDPWSWWSVNSGGEEVVTRINYLGRHSAVLQDLSFDERLARFARMAGPTLRVCDDRLDGPMVFIKNSSVVKGNGDLGWHVDDGIGGHPVMCPLIQAGIQLDHANPANGQLLVIAGSHRYAKHWYAWGDEGDLPVVALETEPGDLTLHFGDAMHTTPPPTAEGAGRRALYYKFALPRTFDMIPAGCHYNDALFRADPEGRFANRAAASA
jgi:hypothetical protein